jgi:hypothetical protein
MTDDVGFAKRKFATALVGFGSGFGRGAARCAATARHADQTNDTSVDEIIPETASTARKKPTVSNVEAGEKRSGPHPMRAGKAAARKSWLRSACGALRSKR